MTKRRIVLGEGYIHDGYFHFTDRGVDSICLHDHNGNCSHPVSKYRLILEEFRPKSKVKSMKKG